MMAAPAPAVTPAPAPAVTPAPAPAVTPAPGTAAVQTAAVPGTPQPAAPPTVRLLQNDKYYYYSFLDPDEHYETSIPVGSDIDFELGEDVSSNLYWRVVSYDANMASALISPKPAEDS